MGLFRNIREFQSPFIRMQTIQFNGFRKPNTNQQQWQDLEEDTKLLPNQHKSGRMTKTSQDARKSSLMCFSQRSKDQQRQTQETKESLKSRLYKHTITVHRVLLVLSLNITWLPLPQKNTMWVCMNKTPRESESANKSKNFHFILHPSPSLSHLPPSFLPPCTSDDNFISPSESDSSILSSSGLPWYLALLGLGIVLWVSCTLG